MLNIELDSYDVPLGRVIDGSPLYGTLPTRLADWPAHSLVHALRYGVRQLLNDAIADKTDDDGNRLTTAQIVAKAAKRRDALAAGELRVARESVAVDPIEAMIARMAIAAIKSAVAKTDAFKSVKPGKGIDRHLVAWRVLAKMPKGEWPDAVNRYVEKNPDVRDRAIAQIAADTAAQANAY